VVHEGVRWKIGNGIKIPLFEASWLRSGGCIWGVGQFIEVITHAKVNSPIIIIIGTIT